MYHFALFHIKLPAISNTSGDVSHSLFVTEPVSLVVSRNDSSFSHSPPRVHSTSSTLHATPKRSFWDQLLLGSSEFILPRVIANQKAEPLDEHTVECLTFLRRIDRVHLTEDPHQAKSFVIDVFEKGNDQPWFTLHRTRTEVRDLHSLVRRWADCHTCSAIYEVSVCGYCHPIINDKLVWPSGIDSVFSSTATKVKLYNVCLNALVSCGSGDVDHEYVCLGIKHILSVLARFLLYDVDQTKL